jgi:predicted Zn-dependent peptidase
MMEFHTYTLPNGIRLIHKETNREVAHCGLVINAGSRDEEQHEQGLAHFIEHAIFKGTVKRKPYHILNRLDRVGAEINAYTTKEETWIYASFINKDFERAVELIADISLNATFPEKELVKERDVIIDEINSYRDNPGEQIFDDFEELLFEGHSIGRNILGTLDSVRTLSREDIFNFKKRRYVTENMVFSSVGNIPFKRVKRLAEKFFGGYQQHKAKEDRRPYTEYQPRHKVEEADTHQVHHLLGSTAYNFDHPLKTGLVVLNNFLGGPAMNSRLNMGIREKHGLAYNVESNYTPYSDTGVFEIYLGTDPAYFEKSRGLIAKELRGLREKKLGATQLQQAKKQLIGQIALAQDSGAGTMLALGKSYLLYDRVDSLQEVFRKIEEVTSDDLIEIANEIFDESRMSSLTLK